MGGTLTLLEVKEQQEKNTQLLAAARLGQIDKVIFWITEGADVNTVNQHGDTPLHQAAVGDPDLVPDQAIEDGCVECVDYLIKVGADVDIKNVDGKTPLHIAVIRAQLRTMDKLIAAGADVNALDNEGNTPLYRAVRNCYWSVCAFLMTCGADINKVNKEGLSPLDRADPRFRETLLQMNTFLKEVACLAIWEMPETMSPYKHFLQWIPSEVLSDVRLLVETPTVLSLIWSRFMDLFNEYPQLAERLSSPSQSQKQERVSIGGALINNPYALHSPVMGEQEQINAAENLLQTVGQEFLERFGN